MHALSRFLVGGLASLSLAVSLAGSAAAQGASGDPAAPGIRVAPAQPPSGGAPGVPPNSRPSRPERESPEIGRDRPPHVPGGCRFNDRKLELIV